MKDRGVSSIIVVIAIVIVVAIAGIGSYLLLKSEKKEGGLTPHDPIHIEGNAGFTAANGVVAGSGTADDPYIIECWDISSENAKGVWIENTDARFIIRNCYVHDGYPYNSPFGGGIFFKEVKNGKVEKCTLENNYEHIALFQSYNNTISNNTCQNRGYYGIELAQSSNNTLSNNTCLNNSVYGIVLGASDNNSISTNIAKNNRGGIVLINDSNNNFISGNIVENNIYNGIFITSDSDNNLIYHNNFMNNENQAYDNGSNFWDNGYPSGGNYWSDYTGTDVDGNGIGDTPYYILGDNNQDRYPLMNPV